MNYTNVYCLLFGLLLVALVFNSSKEGLTNFEKYSHSILNFNKDAVINYNDTNSPLYSHTVDLPINNPISCQNFCGPKARCAISGEQCTSDIDCSGCNPGPTPVPDCVGDSNVQPYDAAGKLGPQLTYSPLTTGYNGHINNLAPISEDSLDKQIVKPYEGVNIWSESFNKGLELYNSKQESAAKYGGQWSLNGFTKFDVLEQRYPMSTTATGEFYSTMPPASNAQTN